MIEATAGKGSEKAVGSEEVSPGASTLTLADVVNTAATRISAKNPSGSEGLGQVKTDEASGAAVTAGTPAASVTTAGAAIEKSVAEIDFSFQERREMTVGTFTSFWVLEPDTRPKYSLDENWPVENLIRHPRNAGSAIQGAVQMALWKLGYACQQGIKAENFILSLLEPTKQLLAYPGPAAESVKRD